MDIQLIKESKSMFRIMYVYSLYSYYVHEKKNAVKTWPKFCGKDGIDCG